MSKFLNNCLFLVCCHFYKYFLNLRIHIILALFWSIPESVCDVTLCFGDVEVWGLRRRSCVERHSLLVLLFSQAWLCFDACFGLFYWKMDPPDNPRSTGMTCPCRVEWHISPVIVKLIHHQLQNRQNTPTPEYFRSVWVQVSLGQAVLSACTCIVQSMIPLQVSQSSAVKCWCGFGPC